MFLYLSSENDHIRIIYVIRRAPSSKDDGKLWINIRKKIQETFEGKIVPFNTSDLKYITMDNTGFRIRLDKHDYNSFRIDVNISETRDPMMIIEAMLLAVKGLAELDKIIDSRPSRCFVSFEVRSEGTTIEEITEMLSKKSPAKL